MCPSFRPVRFLKPQIFVEMFFRNLQSPVWKRHIGVPPWYTNRSFSRDVITFQNLKLKIHQSFYPHQAKEVAYLYLFTILQLNSLLRFETRAFWISGFCGCVTHGDDRVCWKIYTYLMILSPFRSWSIRKRVYVNTCIFSTDNQSPR